MWVELRECHKNYWLAAQSGGECLEYQLAAGFFLRGESKARLQANDVDLTMSSKLSSLLSLSLHSLSKLESLLDIRPQLPHSTSLA